MSGVRAGLARELDTLMDHVGIEARVKPVASRASLVSRQFHIAVALLPSMRRGRPGGCALVCDADERHFFTMGRKIEAVPKSLFRVEKPIDLSEGMALLGMSDLGFDFDGVTKLAARWIVFDKSAAEMVRGLKLCSERGRIVDEIAQLRLGQGEGRLSASSPLVQAALDKGQLSDAEQIELRSRWGGWVEAQIQQGHEWSKSEWQRHGFSIVPQEQGGAYVYQPHKDFTFVVTNPDDERMLPVFDSPVLVNVFLASSGDYHEEQRNATSKDELARLISSWSKTLSVRESNFPGVK